VQDRLGGDFGSKIAFASITIDPEHDTPEMLKLYAQTYGADAAFALFEQIKVHSQGFQRGDRDAR
jgi:cytochrome oxidase Cu insertion factor (SCO1/SenC/PrrC family)